MALLILVLLQRLFLIFFFFFNHTATTEIYTLSLHDALPISLPPKPSNAPPRPLARRSPNRTNRKSVAPNNSAHRRFVEVDATDLNLADLRGNGELLQSLVRDKALIQAGQSIHESFQDAFQTGNDLRKLSQGAPTVQFLRVVGHGLDAQHTFALGINLQGQLAAMQLEDRQIIGRSLDRDFPFGRLLFPFAVWGATLVSQNRLDRLQVQPHAAAVRQRLKNLVHVPADFEDQVAAVLDLVVRVLVMKPAPL